MLDFEPALAVCRIGVSPEGAAEAEFPFRKQVQPHRGALDGDSLMENLTGENSLRYRVHLNLGKVYRYRGDKRQALGSFLKGLELHHDCFDGLMAYLIYRIDMEDDRRPEDKEYVAAVLRRALQIGVVIPPDKRNEISRFLESEPVSK